MEDLHKLYHKTMIMTGFIKSTVGTLFISAGTTVSVAPLIVQNLPDHTILEGIILILIGFIIYYAGDIYNINRNRDMEDMRLQKAGNLVDVKIKEERSRLAEQVLTEYEHRKAELKEELDMKMDKIQQGVCQIPGSEDVEYCGPYQNNIQLQRIRYPDSVSADEILRIGIEKLEGRKGKNITTNDISKYCNRMYEAGLISKKKLGECLERVDKNGEG